MALSLQSIGPATTTCQRRPFSPYSRFTMSISKHRPKPNDIVLTFPSDLGWMGVVVAGGVVKRLTFGHPSSTSAKKAALGGMECGTAKPNIPLVRRLQKYASGKLDSLRDIHVDLGPIGGFQRRVFEQCRRIPYGKTMSYAELAAKAGSPRAARAVGNCMAANRIPLLVPCHRVVCSDGRLGSYSAPGGVAMKRRILALEGARHKNTAQSHP
jgi:methylated-DNA-[protein]-cysteine S-methyltransferase